MNDPTLPLPEDNSLSDESAGTEKNTVSLKKLGLDYVNGKIDREQLRQLLLANKLVSEERIDTYVAEVDKIKNLPKEPVFSGGRRGRKRPATPTPEVANPTPPMEPDPTGGGSNMPPSNTTTQADADRPDRRFADAWTGFVRSIRTLTLDSIASLPRFTDQFRQWASRILTVAESASIADLLQQVYDSTEHEVREFLLMEYQAFIEAVEVARQTESGEKWPAARRTLLGIGGTAIDSLKDIFSDFIDKNPYLKGVITLFSEVLGVFRGD